MKPSPTFEQKLVACAFGLFVLAVAIATVALT